MRPQCGVLSATLTLLGVGVCSDELSLRSPLPLGRDECSPLLAGHAVTCVAFSKDHPDFFALATDGGSMHVASALTGLVWAIATGHEGSVSGLDWATADGATFLVYVSLDKTCRIWL